VLLDARSNVFCVAVNRASSVLAGTLATLSLWLLALGSPLTLKESVGRGLLVLALAVLAWRIQASWPRGAAITSSVACASVAGSRFTCTTTLGGHANTFFTLQLAAAVRMAST